MNLGIDASSAGSGGAKRHLIELLSCFDPQRHGFDEVVIISSENFLAQLPEKSGVTRFTHPLLNGGRLRQAWWQFIKKDKILKDRFDVLWSPFGTYTGSIRPYVSMSRNMLIFDPHERKRFGVSVMRMKLGLLFQTQSRSFSHAQGLIFISEYARRVINRQVRIDHVKQQIIHHGISSVFRKPPSPQREIGSYDRQQPFKFLYVSTIWVYKHPWNVVMAVAALRKKGYPVSLQLVGNVEQVSAGEKLEAAIKKCDTAGEFIDWQKNVSLEQVKSYYHSADAFIFASTCENMPNILLEAMSSGLPIACSSYGPMPEFLKNGGLYMDPVDESSIEKALEQLIADSGLRSRLAQTAYDESARYSWQRCADETFIFLKEIAHKSDRYV